VELTDEQWVRVFDAAFRAAQRALRDPTAAEDVAAMTVERMLEVQAEIPDDRIEAYARTVVRNLLVDKGRRAQRGATAAPVAHEELEEGMGVFGLALHAKDPLVKLLKSERIRRRTDLARRILDSLSDRERALIELALAGATAAEIADELGYASAGTVRVTHMRIRQRLGNEFARDFTPSLFSTSSD
jgi:RNA polymerase sigma factor (sigma-70 family)